MKPTYEELEAKCAALAAENAGLKAATIFLVDEASQVYKRWNLIQQPDGDLVDMQTIHETVCACHETPATDAFLAEVRAQGVEMFAASLGSPYLERGEECYQDGYTHAIERIKCRKAPEFVAQIRKGVQS